MRSTGLVICMVLSSV